MTTHMPSQQSLLLGAATAAATLAVVFVAFDWRTIIGWLIVVGLLRMRYGRRHSRGLIVRGLEAVGIAGGGLVGWRGLRAEARRRDELHTARLETEQARAEELRSRAEHRRRTREEQEKAERGAYWRGAVDASHS
jgi:hypothetical protein